MAFDETSSGAPADRRVRRRNRRGEGDRLRDEIVAAATVLLERSGTEESLSLRAIAREVGITAPSISRHFEHLTQIIDAVVAQELAGLHEALVTAGQGAGGPVERLLALSRAYVRYGRDRPGSYRVLVGRRYLDDWDRDNLTMESTAPLLAACLQLVADAVQACIDAGASASTDARFDTHVLWFALHGLVTVPQAITSLEWPDEELLIRACVTRSAQLIPSRS